MADASEIALTQATSMTDAEWDQFPLFVVCGHDGMTTIFAFADGHPADMIDMLVAAQGPFDAEWVALSFEGWTIPPTVTDEERLTWLGRYHEHPERQEIRQHLVITSDGDEGYVTQVRGEQPKAAESDVKVSGRIPEALRRSIAKPHTN